MMTSNNLILIDRQRIRVRVSYDIHQWALAIALRLYPGLDEGPWDYEGCPAELSLSILVGCFSINVDLIGNIPRS